MYSFQRNLQSRLSIMGVSVAGHVALFGEFFGQGLALSDRIALYGKAF